jgi:N utilization substance protein A
VLKSIALFLIRFGRAPQANPAGFAFLCFVEEIMALKSPVPKTAEEIQSDLIEKLRIVSDEKNIPVEELVASIEGALVSAYKKAFGGSGAVRVVANIPANDFRVFAQKRVVQTALNPNIEVAWREARNNHPNINLGEEVEEEVTPSGFGRIAAQTAKQVLLQKVREAESRQVASEFAEKSNKMFRGTVQRIERKTVIIQLGKAEAVLPEREQIRNENYRTGDSFYVYVTDVRTSWRGPSITVSRTHPGLVRELFALEVPEIEDGIVELKAVAREAGQRTKIAVAAENPDVDPVGACVGPRGNRVGKVVDELGNEKVDIVRWNDDPIQFISNALSPAQISKVLLAEDQTAAAQGTATVIVAEDQQSLAIGKQGQNVRLAARLTNWRIDIRTEKQYAEEQAKRMFALDDDAPAREITRESESVDALAGVFAVDSDILSLDGADETATDEAATPEGLASDSANDVAEAEPIAEAVADAGGKVDEVDVDSLFATDGAEADAADAEEKA